MQGQEEHVETLKPQQYFRGGRMHDRSEFTASPGCLVSVRLCVDLGSKVTVMPRRTLAHWESQLEAAERGKLTSEAKWRPSKDRMIRRVDDRWYLPVAGFVSGLLTCFAPALLFRLGSVLALFIGCVFGAVISAHVRFFRGVQSPFRLFGFITTCTLAYTMAEFATGSTPFRPEFLNFSGASSAAENSSPFFSGGFLGAAIICAGIYFFLAPSKNWPKFLLKALGISVACGFLGVLGWSVGQRLWIARWSYSANLSFYTLYIIWQTGAASLFGLLLSPQQTFIAAPQGVRPAYAPLQRKTERAMPPVGAIAFLVLVVATLAWFIVPQVRNERTGRRKEAAREAAQQAIQQRLDAARPSSENLPTVVELPVEQVLVAKPIAGYPCGPHFKWKGSGNSVGYTAEYKRPEAISDGDISFADVNVTLYPNSDWAVYTTKVGFGAYFQAENPQAVSTLTKFGNKVIMNTMMRYPDGHGDLYFSWASGSKLVQVTFRGPEEDEFLKEYLALYPSDL